jgi:hypothetical protein
MAKLKGGTRIYGDVKIDGGIYDSSNQVGVGGSVLISTGVGIAWTSSAGSGAQGAQGTQGRQGLQGLSVQGVQGIAGSVQGNQGAQGLQGTQGSGAQGSQGAQGAQGRQGLQGLSVQGVQGLAGSVQGAQGAQGVQGLSNQGTQGTQGIQGSQGLQGLQGLSVQGIQGIAGSAQGAQGAQGLQGNQGVGSQGAQGTQGRQGLQGLSVQGSQGIAGSVQGAQGAQGLQGTQGIGVQGIQGLAGSAQGTQGTQGTVGQSAANVGKVFYYDSGSTSDVVGFSSALSNPSASGTTTQNVALSGTTTVLAASFITLQASPGVVDLPAGSGTHTIYANVDAGEAFLTVEIYKSNSTGGSLTLLSTTNSGNFTNTTATAISWNYTLSSATTLLTSDRLAFRIYATRVSGPNNITVTLSYEGTNTQSNVLTTISSGPSGPQGTQGIAGSVQGAQGAQGLQGRQGAQGVGVQGIQGLAGSLQGAQGAQGTRGNFTVFSQATAPTSPGVGDYWVDTDDGTTYVYYNDGNSSQWIEFGPTPQEFNNAGINIFDGFPSFVGFSSRIDFSSGLSVSAISGGIATVSLASGAGGGGSGKFDTSIDNSLFVQPTGTLEIVGVGTTTSQITTLTSSSPKYIVHSLHVTNITASDTEITAGFLDATRKISTTVATGAGSSGGAGIHTFSVASSSNIRIGMAVTGTGNAGDTTGIGTTGGFQYNTYVTSVDGNSITLDKSMSGRAVGNVFFTPVSKVVSRLPIPAYGSVELLKQPMVLNALDSIVLQSTAEGSGIGSVSTSNLSQTAGSNFITVTAGAAITNYVAPGMLVLPTGTNTGIQTNTFVGNYSSGSLSIPITRPARTSVANTAFSFTEVVVPADGTNQVTIVYQTSSDTTYQDGMGTVVGIDTQGFIAGIVSSVPNVYYGTGNLYPSIIQSIRVSNISDSLVYPGGDYKVSVGIGNSDTVLSWLAYDMTIPKNSSIELCEAPKRLGIGQSIFAAAEQPDTIEIQIAAKQKTS